MSVSGPQQRIQLTLTPEHLGTIRITFNQVEDEVVGVLEVQKGQTRREVEQSLPQLISAMQNTGVQVRRIDVVQWNVNQGAVEDGAAKESDYFAAGQFYDESSANSSESEVFENRNFDGNGPELSSSGEIPEPNSRNYSFGDNESGLNVFI